jgi:integrase
VPTGLSHDEAMSIISQMNEKYCLMFSLLYVCGIRKAELLKLRVKDIDFAAKSVFIYFYEPMPASSGWLLLSASPPLDGIDQNIEKSGCEYSRFLC